jgi:hypothetical protein
MVARPTMRDIPAIEIADSLRRFNDPIRSILTTRRDIGHNRRSDPEEAASEMRLGVAVRKQQTVWLAYR